MIAHQILAGICCPYLQDCPRLDHNVHRNGSEIPSENKFLSITFHLEINLTKMLIGPEGASVGPDVVAHTSVSPAVLQ